MKYNGITIKPDRDKLLSDHAKKLLKDFYMQNDETSPQEAYARASLAWSGGDNALAQRLYDYSSNNYFVFASPLLSNASIPGQQAKGLPISCYLSYVGDTLHSLIDHSAELRWLSVKGGGVGGHWSDVRSVSDIAPGPIPFIHTVDADMLAYRQGKTRKGSYAAYLEISHPDVLEFIGLRTPTGDVNRKCLNLHHAINITDKFMATVLSGGKWNLVDPKTKEVKDTIPARQLWEFILETRYRTGEPYLNFIDEANRHLPESQKKKGLKIHGSNLCNEIHLATDENRTAVCCLSSLNLEYWDEWKDTSIVEDLITMLDNVISYFIDAAPAEFNKAIFSAKAERSIGLGTMGLHSMFQRKEMSFESKAAGELNEKIFKEIKEKAVAQSKKLAEKLGEPLDMGGTGLRNGHLLAIAPNANSSIIADTSPSIEPYEANAFVHRTRAGSFLVKNKYLEDVLKKYRKNNDETWSSIISSNGSVMHLSFLNGMEKAVFKTAMEIDQNIIIDLASARQKYICQGQSVNLFFKAGTDKKHVNAVHLNAWKKKLKGLYYLRTEASSKAENIGEMVEREALKNHDEQEECQVCKV